MKSLLQIFKFVPTESGHIFEVTFGDKTYSIPEVQVKSGVVYYGFVPADEPPYIVAASNLTEHQTNLIKYYYLHCY